MSWQYLVTSEASDFSNGRNINLSLSNHIFSNAITNGFVTQKPHNCFLAFSAGVTSASDVNIFLHVLKGTLKWVGSVSPGLSTARTKINLVGALANFKWNIYFPVLSSTAINCLRIIPLFLDSDQHRHLGDLRLR